MPPRMLAHDGETLSIKDWSRITGIHRETIRCRLDHLGMSVADALKPVIEKFRPRKEKSAYIPRSCPKMRLHKSSGQACSRWRSQGKQLIRYFGLWKSAEATTAYQRFAMEWATGMSGPGDEPAERFTVSDLVERFIEHAERYYLKGGKQTSEVAGQKAALFAFNELNGERLVSEIKGPDLKQYQQALVTKGLARETINKYTWRIANCFRWGVSEDLVHPDIAAKLKSVRNLQPGRTRAADNDPVLSVPLAHIEAVIPHLHSDHGRRAVLTAMVRAMIAIGCRPGELCAMSTAAIDTTGDVWCYRVGGHKNLHRAARRKPKVVWVGPKAQAILKPYIDNARADGRVWVFPSRGKNGVARTTINPAPFAEFVRLACKRAKVAKPWTPHQLRHNRATEVRNIYECDEAAAAIIGDTPAVAASVYADPTEAIARRIALASG